MGLYKTKPGCWYFTFGSGQLQNFKIGQDPNRIVLVVEDATEWGARQKVFDSPVGDKFCTSYDYKYAQEYLDSYVSSVVTLHQLLGLENKYQHHSVVEICSEDDLPDIFQSAINGGTHLLHSLYDSYLGTYYVWPDGSYCLDTEANEFQWKSDDYYIIQISDS